MTLKEEIVALEKAANKEILKVMEIDKKTKIEYIYNTFLNIMFRFDEIRIYIIGMKKKGDKK